MAEKKKKPKGFKMHVKLTFTEPLLGTVPKDPTVYTTFIADNSPEPEVEAGTVPQGATAEERGWTGFHEEGGKLFLYNYTIKGFFKDACSMLSRIPDSCSASLTAFRKCIDGLIFIRPRRIPLVLSGPLGQLERPLRAQTAQGERVALARSDTAPIGSSIEFDVECLGGIPVECLDEWLDYGQNRGLGQWRNAEYGTFTAEWHDC
jgi:hypothetical protein